MADGVNFSIVAFSLIAGVVVVFLLYITKIIRSVGKFSDSNVEEPKKPTNNSSGGKKQPKQQEKTKKKNVRVREGKHNFSHPWLLTSLKGHTQSVLDMELSPNGKYLATCGEDRAVLVWRTKDWSEKEHRSLRVNVEYDHGRLIRWSPDSKAFLVCKATANELQAYRVVKKTDGWLSGVTKGLTYPKVHSDDIVGLGIASSGRFIVTCSDKTDLVLTDVKGAVLANVDTLLMQTYCAGVTPCGRYVYAAGFAPDAKLWEVQFTKTGEFNRVIRAFELRGHTSGIYSVAFNADCTRAATVSKDNTWRLYNINVEWQKGEDPKLLQTGSLPAGSHASALALSPSGDVVAVASDGDLLVYFADTAELDTSIPEVFFGETITQLLFDAQGRYILASGEKHVRVFHNVTGHRAVAALAKARITQPGQSAAMRERLELQIQTAEALVASLS